MAGVASSRYAPPPLRCGPADSPPFCKRILEFVSVAPPSGPRTRSCRPLDTDVDRFRGTECWKWQLEKGPLWPREKGPPVSSVCCQLLTSFLEDCSSAALRLPLIGGAQVGVWTVGSEPDVGVGHAGPGYPRETERPGRAGRCGRRRRSGKVVPSSDPLSAAEGSSGARGECGVGRHRLLRQACL